MIAQEVAAPNTAAVWIALIGTGGTLATVVITHLLTNRKQSEMVHKQDELAHKQDQAAVDQVAQADAIQEVHVLTNDRVTKLDAREVANNARISVLEIAAAANRDEIAALKAALTKAKRKPKAKGKR